MLSAEFLTLFLSCLEAMNPISLVFLLTVMFTVLKGFEMNSTHAMHLQSYSLLGSLTCLGVTYSYLVLK